MLIDGSYQHDALHNGPALQRAWHRDKFNLFERRFPIGPGERGIDVGCGSGVITNHLADRGCKMLGVDGNTQAVAFAQQAYERAACRFEISLVDDLDATLQSFDFAVCLEVIEHLYEPQGIDLVSSIYSRLKPGGRLLLTTPNYRGAWPAIEWLMDRSSSAPKLDEDQHVSHYYRRSLSDLLMRAGYVDITVGTYSTMSPFVGSLSERSQPFVAHVEEKVRLPFGNLLVATARTAAE